MLILLNCLISAKPSQPFVLIFQGLDQLLDKMTEILNCHKHHQEVRFKIAEKYEKLLEVVMETVKREKIIDLSLGLTEKLSINGKEFHQIAKLLHEQVITCVLKYNSTLLIRPSLLQ
jgi:hypothetical protein